MYEFHYSIIVKCQCTNYEMLFKNKNNILYIIHLYNTFIITAWNL